MTNPTKPALDLDELEAAAKGAMAAHPNDDYFLFDDLVTPPTVLALIEVARERNEAKEAWCLIADYAERHWRGAGLKELGKWPIEVFAKLADTVDDLYTELDVLEAKLTTLRAQLAQAQVYVERARFNLSFAKQDAVSTSAEAEANRNSAYHDCVAALAVITPAASTGDKS